MKQIFEIKDAKMIEEFLSEQEYGVLALSMNNRPYSVPLNFVKVGDALYFHGAKKGKKVTMMQNNSYASFSVVKSHSMIQSYFSSKDALACPATQFFQSVIIDGKITFVEEYEEKVMAMSALMQKLQPEGKYKPLSEDIYKKALNATLVYKLNIEECRAKYKFGQHLSKERFEMIIEHLQERNRESDRETIQEMKRLYKEVV